MTSLPPLACQNFIVSLSSTRRLLPMLGWLREWLAMKNLYKIFCSNSIGQGVEANPQPTTTLIFSQSTCTPFTLMMCSKYVIYAIETPYLDSLSKTV